MRFADLKRSRIHTESTYAGESPGHRELLSGWLERPDRSWVGDRIGDMAGNFRPDIEEANDSSSPQLDDEWGRQVGIMLWSI